MKINCFLPCRRGSQRVPLKNIKPFLGNGFGLVEIKLNQLLTAKYIDKIYLSTNDETIINYSLKLKAEKIIIHKRNEELSNNTTSTDTLVKHASELISGGHILWTHVTSPFITAEIYDEVISVYKKYINKGYDSLMTTNIIQSFIWSEKGPINYDRNIEKWPRTQTLRALHEINSGIFLNSSENYIKLKDRIGNKPYLYSLNKYVGFDIDWQDDFELAELILKDGLANIY